MIFIGIFTFGVIVGLIAGIRVSRNKSIGSLCVEYSDPDEPYLFLHLNPDSKPETLKPNTRVTFDVEFFNLNSQK